MAGKASGNSKARLLWQLFLQLPRLIVDFAQTAGARGALGFLAFMGSGLPAHLLSLSSDCAASSKCVIVDLNSLRSFNTSSRAFRKMGLSSPVLSACSSSCLI